jgi:hypothetical protein
MRKLLIALCACAAFIPAMANAEASAMKYPNWYLYVLASNEWAEHQPPHRGDGSWHPYLDCNYTNRTCLKGLAGYDADGVLVDVLGMVVDGEDRKTVLAHVECRPQYGCANFDTGINQNGEEVTMPDVPSSCVEEMRKHGTKCKGYSLTLGFPQ